MCDPPVTPPLLSTPSLCWTQLAINILIEFIQIAQIAMSPATVTFLYVDVLALRGSASPCVLPLEPLDGLAFRGSLPLFLFVILGIMMGVEVVVRVCPATHPDSPLLSDALVVSVRTLSRKTGCMLSSFLPCRVVGAHTKHASCVRGGG